MIVAGIGCRGGCSAEEIVDLVRQAAAEAGCRVGALAIPWFKAGAAAPQAAAATLGVELRVVGEAALVTEAARCPTRSAAAERHVGVASVAEGAALAASGARGRLVLARIAAARATCALAAEDAA